MVASAPSRSRLCVAIVSRDREEAVFGFSRCGPGPAKRSAANDHFPQVIASEEKFHRTKFLKKLLQAAIVEILNRPHLVARRQRHDLRFYNPVGVERSGLRLLLGVEKREQRRLGPKNTIKPVDGVLQQRRRQELQSVPDERAVETALRKLQILAKKQRGAFRIGLIGD